MNEQMLNYLKNKEINLDKYSDKELEFIFKILYQIPELSNKLLQELFKGIEIIDSEEITLEDYIKTEYNKIMASWHKKNPVFNMPNGVITLSVNGEIDFIKIGDNPTINESSLYDIASITKLYTEVVLLRIIKEGKYKITLDTKLKEIKLNSGKSVQELYPKLNLDMTIRELISFNNAYITDTDIRNLNNRIDAINALRTVHTDKVKEGNYLYTDLPIMIFTDLIEQVTGKEYKELLNEYIVRPLDLYNTFMDLDFNNKQRYTGLNKNGVNDPKSNIINGGGHAGIITDAYDLIKFLNSILKPGLIFTNDMDPMLFDMLGITKTTNGKYNRYGTRIDKIVNIEELEKSGVSKETINQIIKEIKKPRESGVSIMGNLNVAAEGFKVNDYIYDGIAPQTIPYKGFMVQGSTRVQGDVADFVIDGEIYRTASSILMDIHNQYKSIKKVDTGDNATKEYYVEGKGMMKMADARKSGLSYFGGYYDKISNMLSIARIMKIYSQYRKLNKKKTR